MNDQMILSTSATTATFAVLVGDSAEVRMARRLRSVVWWIAIGLSLILLPVWPFALALVWFDGLGGSTLSTLVFLAASALNVGFILRPVLAPAEAIVEAIARTRAAR